MEITLKIVAPELCEAIHALANSMVMGTKAVENQLSYVEETDFAAAPKEKPTSGRVVPTVAKPKEEPKEEPKVTLDELRVLAHKLVKEHPEGKTVGKEKLRQCLVKVGAKRVTDCSPEQLANIKPMILKALEG